MKYKSIKAKKLKFTEFTGLLMMFIVMTASCSRNHVDEMDRVDQSTPEAVITSFYEAVTDQDVRLLELVLDQDDDATEKMLIGIKNEFENGLKFQISNVKITIDEENETEMEIRTQYDQTVLLNEEIIGSGLSGDRFTLIQKEGSWYIRISRAAIPPDLE